MAYSYTRRHVKAIAEASNSTGGGSVSDGSQHLSSNHYENWNPNQIVYNKVSPFWFDRKIDQLLMG